MTDKEKHDVRSSVRRVAIAIRKSPKLTKAIEDGEGSKKLTELFCTEIMRPSHKFEKARARGQMDEELFRTPAAERGFGEGGSKS